MPLAPFTISSVLLAFYLLKLLACCSFWLTVFNRLTNCILLLYFFLYLNWNLWLSFVFFFSWLMAGWSSFATVHSIVCYLCCFYVKCIPAFLNGYYNYIDYKMHSLDSHSFRMFFQFKVSFSKLYISHENFRYVLYKFYLIEFLFIGIDLVFLWLPKKAWFNFTRFIFNGFLSSSSGCTILRSLFLKKKY